MAKTASGRTLTFANDKNRPPADECGRPLLSNQISDFSISVHWRRGAIENSIAAQSDTASFTRAFEFFVGKYSSGPDGACKTCMSRLAESTSGFKSVAKHPIIQLCCTSMEDRGGPQYRRPPLGSRGRIISPSCTGINVEPAGRFARMAKWAAVD